jgi:CRISPR-associated protein Csm5
MGENLYQILECVPAFYAHGFSGQLAIQRIELNASDKLPSKSLRFSITEIAEACNRFYLPQLTAERKLLQERDYVDANWHKQLGDLLNLSQDKIKSGNAFLLRVGRHSGAEAVTVSGARNGNIKIMKGKNQPPEYADAPKTLWLAANEPKQRINLLPFGWLLVEVHPGNAAVTDWPELARLCQSQQTQARQWAEKLASQKIQLAEKRRAEEQRRQQEELDRKQRLEQALANEQARLAQQQEEERRRMAMTEEQLRIEVLRQLLKQKQARKVREQIGGPLYSDLRLLIEQAADWPGEAKAELAELGKSLLEYIGASGNKKAKDLLKTLL